MTLKLASAVIASMTSSFNNSFTEYSSDASYVYTIIESLMCMYCLANAEIQFVTLAISCLSSSVIGYTCVIVYHHQIIYTTYIVLAGIMNRGIIIIICDSFKFLMYPNISIETKYDIDTTGK